MPDHVDMPPLLVEMAIEPKSEADQERLGHALAKLVAKDASFRVSIDRESGQTILKGLSEDHLEGKADILTRHDIGVRVGAPQVAFLEHPTRRVEAEFTYDKHIGPKRQFASVKLAVEPNEPGKDYRFVSKVTEDAIPSAYIAGVQKGIESVLASGVVAGFPVIDARVELIDGKYDDIDSSPLAFEIASRAAFREALQKANSVLLEPIMKVEVVTPSEYAAAVIYDLNLKRGQIEHQKINGSATINATVPLINMFGYGRTLHTMSEGHATFVMRFGHYAPAAPQPEYDPPFKPAIGMRA